MTDLQHATDTITVTIDGRQLVVPKGTLAIRAAEQLGITIPRFCDHPLLDPVAACRQCLVEVEGQRKPLTACSTQMSDGMVVSTHLTSEIADAGQRSQLEFLLINHPLDCPQCDKGGECPLQDQALAHGPGESRFNDYKRRYEKPVPISPQIGLDRERCVLCARCTRFSSEISGDPFIELFERGALQQVAIYADEPYHSYFSGNIVQICPVGALTSFSYRFTSRPFDLRSTKSICNQCSAGCNLRVDTRRGEIQRQLASEHADVNEMWNCDKGRYAYAWVGHADRLRQPLARDEVLTLAPTGWRAALQTAASRLRTATEAGGGAAVGVITGGRLTDEDAYATSRFARDVLGTDNVDFRLRPRTNSERDVLAAVSGTQGPTYADVEAADVTVVAGLDPEEEVPILHLRLRKAWRKRGQRIVVVGPVLGSLAEIAWRWIPTEAGGEAAVLASLGSSEPDASLADVSEALGSAARVVVLAGERLAESPGALRASAGLATHLDAGFAWVPRRAGARGAVDAGLVPGLLPGGRTLDAAGPVGEAWGRLPDGPGLDARGMLEAAVRGEITALYLIGVDLVTDFEDPALAQAALEAVDTVIVQDLMTTPTTAHADVVLPAVASQERVGSFTTWEGRRQPFPAAVKAEGLVQQDWDILRQLARALDVDLGWETAVDVRAEAAPLMASPVSDRTRLAALGPVDPATRPARDDDRLDVVAIPRLLGAGTQLAGAKELQATARPRTVWVNPADAAARGLAEGQAVTLTGDAGSLELPVQVTDAVVTGCVVVPCGAEVGRLSRVGDAAGDGLRVTLEAEGA